MQASPSPHPSHDHSYHLIPSWSWGLPFNFIHSTVTATIHANQCLTAHPVSPMYGCASFSGYLTRADSNWQPVLGWTTDELVGTQIINRVHPDDLDIVVEAIHHLCAGGGALTFECRYLCKDGTYARLTWHVTPHIEHLVMDLAVYRSQPCASR